MASYALAAFTLAALLALTILALSDASERARIAPIDWPPKNRGSASGNLSTCRHRCLRTSRPRRV